ncbi:hypothetical protein [Halorussus caseinilyticus]|uniref:Uncharacterized protein n=1 Tax=Halorussus caseinilyticus TaxID=3034025 RepID=A0ABD5WG76_9EURY|nr:hypothetical protein [Halorussus sp. DT72]
MEENKKPKAGTSRRRVLQSTGAIAGLSALPSTVLGKTTTKKFTGYTYDARSHEVVGGASATIKQYGPQLKGTLSIGDYKIRVDYDRPTEASEEQNAFEFKEIRGGKYQADDAPLQIDLSLRHGTIYGFLTRPTPVHGKLAFSLLPSWKTQAGEADGSHLRIDREALENKRGMSHGIPVYSENLTADEVSAYSQKPSSQTVSSDTITTQSSMGDVGALSEDGVSDTTDFNDYYNTPSDCNHRDDLVQDYQYQMVVEADHDPGTESGQEYNQVGDAGNRWNFQSYFSNEPKNGAVPSDGYAIDPCRPKATEFHVDATWDSGEEVWLDLPDPTDNDLEDGTETNIDATITTGIDLSPVPFLSMGASLSYKVQPETSTSHMNKGYNNNSTGQYYYWNLAYSPTYDDFKTDPKSDSYGVSFRVNQSSASDYHTLHLETTNTFEYDRFVYQNLSSCPTSPGQYLKEVIVKETKPASGYPTFEVL